MKIASIEEFHKFINKKSIGIVGFNKDSRSLLKFYKQGICSADYKIEYLADLTLDYRPKVKALAEQVFPKNKILTKPDALEKMMKKKQVELLINFDWYIDNVVRNIKSISDCSTILQTDYENYKNVSDTAEFNFKWNNQVIDFISGIAAQNGIYSVKAYSSAIDMLTESNSNEYMVTFSRDDLLPLAKYKKGFADAKVRFILGTDWGSGKTSHLFNRMCNGNAGIAFDLWFSLVGNTYLPMLSVHDSFIGKGLIAGEIHKVWEIDPQKEIYVRLGGRIEDFLYGIPVDRRMFLEGLHTYFKNAQYVITCKPTESLSDLGIMLADFKSHYNADNKTEVYRIHYSGEEEKLL
jgi:hypothetical protein